MVNLGSFCVKPLGDDEYENGTIVPLTETPVLTLALLTERWENFDQNDETHWKSVIQSDAPRFVGTVLSDVRRQVEITVVYRSPHRVVTFCVTLGDYSRFQLSP